MNTTLSATGEGAAPAGQVAAMVPFTIASRHQRRLAAQQTINVQNGSASASPIQLFSTGWLRKVSLLIEVNHQCASAGAVVAGDAPWNAISNITLTDALGQPLFQSITGYHLYLLNKYFPSDYSTQSVAWSGNPHIGPEYTYAHNGTVGTARFRLDLDLEQDFETGYGCISNMDSNASLQLRIDFAAGTSLFTGTGVTSNTVSVTVEQHYWLPSAGQAAGVPAMTEPPGAGDYLETRYENQTVNAASENTLAIAARGGYSRGYILVSRTAAGVRTDFPTTGTVSLYYDNVPVDEGIRVDSFRDQMRRATGYCGTELGTSYAPLSSGTLPGLDRGVLVWDFAKNGRRRNQWLATTGGSNLQVRFTPGAAATTAEVLTQLIQATNPEAYWGQQ